MEPKIIVIRTIINVMENECMMVVYKVAIVALVIVKMSIEMFALSCIFVVKLLIICFLMFDCL